MRRGAAENPCALKGRGACIRNHKPYRFTVGPSFIRSRVVADALRRGFAMKSSIRTLLLGGACSLAMMGAAAAADLGALPLRGPVGLGTWNGFYAGVNGGYSW